MPQLGYKIEAINWDSYIADILQPPYRRALERVGFLKGRGVELDWFVRFARMDLDTASPGDLLSLQEEFWALLVAHFRSSPNPMPSREQIIEVQQTVQKHLADLADKQKTMLPALPGVLWILYPRIEANLELGASAGAKMEETSRKPDIVSHRAASGNPANLVSLLGEVLEKAGKPVVRCPHCRTIFLQSRRNQGYCSRSCQSVAIARKGRAEAKRKRTARKPAPKTSAKGGSRHRKKKR